MKKTIKVSCPLCDERESTKLLSMGHKLFPVLISICNQCGFVFQNPRFIKEAWINYYTSGDYDRYERPLPSLAGSNNDPFKNAKEIAKRLESLPQPINILEIGAGRGDIITYLKKINMKAINYMAIEPSKTCQSYLIEQEIKVIGNSIDDFDRSYIGTIDIIILRGVIEHFYNPVESLLSIKELLSADGVIYFDTPNPFCNLFTGGRIPIYFPHISYFTQTTLNYLLEKVGLVSISTGEYEDYIYGIYKKGFAKKIAKEDLNENYLLTKKFINENANIRFYSKLKTALSYIIPNSMLHTYIMKKRKLIDHFNVLEKNNKSTK